MSACVLLESGVTLARIDIWFGAIRDFALFEPFRVA